MPTASQADKVLLVTRAGRAGHIHFESLTRVSPNLIFMTGTRKQVTAVLMEVNVKNPAVVVEPIHHAVAMVSIDVNVENPLETVATLQMSDSDRTVVQNAEAARPLRAGVVESASYQEGSSKLAGHYLID